jgi:hypothetical protein
MLLYGVLNMICGKHSFIPSQKWTLRLKKYPSHNVTLLTQTALMTFVITYKQADLTLTGTMRKAQLAATATKTSRRQNGPGHGGSPAPSIQEIQKRRASSITSISHLLHPVEEKVKQCDKCRVKYSPIWWPMDGRSAEEGGRLLCHKCHWGVQRANGHVNGFHSVQSLLST